MNESNAKSEAGPETTLGNDILSLLRHWLRGRRGRLLLGLVAAAGGMWVGWPALVAAGVAPLLLGVLPCVAMCALGLCMKGGGQSCDSTKTPSVNDNASLNTTQTELTDKRKETDR